MNSGDKYTIHLINQSKQGRKNQFIELSIEFFPRIYSIIFGLVPNIEGAKKICAEVFYIIWKRINSIETELDFKKELQEIAIVRSFIFLQNIEKIELDSLAILDITKENNELFTKVEKEFLQLTYIQRVILVLNDKLELPTKRIAEVLKTLNEEEIREELHSAREVLLKKFPDGKLEEFPEHGWAILNDCLMKLDKGIQQYLEEEVLEFISEYLQQSKNLLDGIFSKITPDNEIIEFLKEYLLKDSINEIAKKDLIQFSKNYTSISTKTTEVLFEKAFTSSKATLSDVNKNLSTVAPVKHNKLWLAFIIGFISIAISLYFYLNFTENRWEVNTGEGIFELNGNQNQIAVLDDGAKISTSGNSKVEIVNSNLSKIEILEKSTIILDEIENNYTKFSLIDGSIKVINRIIKKNEMSSKQKIVIKTDGTEVIPYKGELIISLTKKKGLEVNVERGFAEVGLENITFYLGKKYRFSKNLNNKYVIPFHIDANRELLELIMAVNTQNIDRFTIMEIIKNSSKSDYLTLFNLLLICDRPNRELLLNQLNKYFPLKSLFNWNNLVKLEKKDVDFLKNYLFENPL